LLGIVARDFKSALFFDGHLPIIKLSESLLKYEHDPCSCSQALMRNLESRKQFMSQMPIFHALGLHMHQPPGNMQTLINHNEWEARQIIHCYDRAARYAHKYPDTARLHIAFSGVLLEQLRDKQTIARYRDVIDIPAMLASYREAKNIELLTTGYFHPIFPLIPPADWEAQLVMARQLMEELFGRAPKGFYPPAMMFSMEMIPALVKAGYEYVVIDSWQVHPLDAEFDPFQPYLATFGGASITIVPRDSDLSNAQQYGLEAAWFADEGRQRAQHSVNADKPRLLTTFSDGENSEWFRNMDELYGYFGHFFAPYMEHVNSGEYPIKPIFLSEFIRTYPATVKAQVETPSWQPSTGQQAALQRINALSQVCQTTNAPAVAQARRLLLESETSCFLFWNDAWLDKIHACVTAAEELLAPPKAATPKKPAQKTAHKPASAKKVESVAKPAPASKTQAPKAEVAAKPAPASKAQAPKAEVAAKPAPASKAQAPKAEVAAKPAAPASKAQAPKTEVAAKPAPVSKVQAPKAKKPTAKNSPRPSGTKKT
jgi:4-alpha-glucanotransferase